MYTLHFLPDACSLATQVVLRELGQPFTLALKSAPEDFKTINPVGTVPVIQHEQQTLREGAAILLHLLQQQPSSLFPQEPQKRQQAIEDIMFANATMHPAYGRLFFAQSAIDDKNSRTQFMQTAAQAINSLWQTVEQRLQQQPFLAGNDYSAADIMLAVYSRWGAAFPVDITIGSKTQAMIARIISLPTFQQSLAAEHQQVQEQS